MDSHEAQRSEDREEPLTGGNMSAPVRVGTTVRRNIQPWSPTIQRLLRHLRKHGCDWVPEPLGVDEDGRDSVSYLPGEVPQYPLPEWVWSEEVLTDAAGLLAQLHAAGADFDRTGAIWQLPDHAPPEVVCHNDFAPYNMVFAGGRLVGVIDWDTSSPGPRVWDVAYLAYRLVPLTDPTDVDSPQTDVPHRVDRLSRLCDAYGHGVAPAEVLRVAVARLHELAAFTEDRADEGREDLRSHAELYRRDARWITANLERLE